MYATIKQILFITLTFALFAFALSDNTLTISQIQTGGWDVKGAPYTVWEVTLVNTGSRAIFDATVIAESNLIADKLWSMEEMSANKFHFPGYLRENGGMANGTKHTFGYINKSGAPAIFSICDVKN